MGVTLEELVARLRLDSSSFESGMGRVGGSMQNVGAKMSSVGKRMTLGVTTPLLGIAAAGVKLEASFSSTMRQVAIATGGPSKALSDLAKKMGAETAFSANEAADAMLELAKGGMTAAQIKGGALASTMKLASAGGVELADASTYVSNAMAAFGIKTSKANSVAVALAGAANASSASVESLGQGLSQASLAAKNAGLSLQETTGVLSLFDSQGLKGSDAGTSLKTMLSSLTPSTKKASLEMEHLGLNFVKSNGSFKSIGTVAELLKKKLGGLTEAQRAQSLETIFGSDGVRAATILMNGGAKAVDKYTTASKDSATTNKLAGAAMEGTSGAIERAKGSMETAALTIGETLAPFVEKAAGVIEKLANKFSELSPSSRMIVIIVGAIAAAIGPVLIALGAMATAIGAVGLPVIAVVAGIAALVAVLVAAYTKSATFRAVVQSALAGVASFVQGTLLPAVRNIGATFQQLVAFVTPIVMQLVAVVMANMPQIMQIVRQVFSTVRSIIVAVLTAVRAQITVVLAVIRVLWSVFGETIMATVRRVFPAVLTIIRGVLNVIQGVVRVFTSALRGNWSGVWAALGQIVRGAWQIISGVVRAGIGLIMGIVRGAGAGIAAAARAIWEGVKAAFSAGVRGVVAITKRIGSDIKATFSGAASWLLGIGGDIVHGLTKGISNAAGAVMETVQNLIDKIPAFIRKRMGIASPSKVTTKIGLQITQGLVKGLSGDSVSQVTSASGRLVDAIQSTMNRRIESDKLAQAATKRIVARLSGERHAVLANAKAYEAMTTRVKDATSKLNDLVKARSDMASQIASNATGSIADVSSTSGAVTAASVEADARKRLAAVQTFTSNLSKLQTMGASSTVLAQLSDKGVEQGGAVAAALVAGGPDAVRRISSLQDQIGSAAGALGDHVAGRMYDAGIRSAQGLANGLQSQADALRKRAERLADVLIRATRRALKIHSPSRVFTDLGRQVGAGMALGIDSTQRRVAQSVDRLVPVPPIGLGQTSSSSSSSDAAGVKVTIHAPQLRSDEQLGQLVGGRVAAAIAGRGSVPPSVGG